MTTPITVRSKVNLRGKRREPLAVTAEGRIPRVARLLALAHRFEQLIRDGVVADYAELARLGHVSRARVTQIMDLLNLAPDIQEKILFLRVHEASKTITERQLRETSIEPAWHRQRVQLGSLRLSVRGRTGSS